MLKYILRNVLLYAAGLYVLPFIFSGVYIRNGLGTLIIAGCVLLILNRLIAPVINLITLPLHFASFGLFRFIVNAFMLYLLTVLVPEINITAFKFPGFVILGFVFPKMYFNTFFAYIVSALVFTIFVDFIKWLHEVHL